MRSAALFSRCAISLAHDLDPLVGDEKRSLPVVAGDPDDQAIYQPHVAPDDVGVPVGDRVEVPE